MTAQTSPRSRADVNRANSQHSVGPTTFIGKAASPLCAIERSFWRMRRFRELEARAWTPENLDTWVENGMLALINRSMACEAQLPQTLAMPIKKPVASFLQKLNRTPPHIRFIDPEEDDPEENICLSGFVPFKNARSNRQNRLYPSRAAVGGRVLTRASISIGASLSLSSRFRALARKCLLAWTNPELSARQFFEN